MTFGSDCTSAGVPTAIVSPWSSTVIRSQITQAADEVLGTRMATGGSVAFVPHRYWIS